jgi:hypothetical protein
VHRRWARQDEGKDEPKVEVEHREVAQAQAGQSVPAPAVQSEVEGRKSEEKKGWKQV